MRKCTRFTTEGLLRLEQGEPLDKHFDTCPDCRTERRVYEHLRRAIAQVGAHLEPPPGWSGRVWEAIDVDGKRVAVPASELRPSVGRLLAGFPVRILASAAAMVLVAVAIATVWLYSTPAEISLTSRVVVEQSTRRGDDAHPGDILQLRANTGGARFADLRVYLNSAQLVVGCSSEFPCRRSGDSIELDLQLESVGTYQAVLFLAPGPLPESTEDLDRDAGAALEMGARVEPGVQIVVR
jgi:hypothetical protein